MYLIFNYIYVVFLRVVACHHSYLLVGCGWNAADKHLALASAVVAKGSFLRKIRLWNCSFCFYLPSIDGMQVAAHTVDDQGVLEDDETESSVCSTWANLWSLFPVLGHFKYVTCKSDQQNTNKMKQYNNTSYASVEISAEGILRHIEA